MKINQEKTNLYSLLCALVFFFSFFALYCLDDSLAYFYDQGQKTNTFTARVIGADNISISLEEPNWQASEGLNLTVSRVVEKDPTIINEGEDAYVRAIVSFKDGVSGEIISDPRRWQQIYAMLYYAEEPLGGKISAADLSELARVNPAFSLDAERSSEGKLYFNYEGILATGESTSLFLGIAVPYDWGKSEMALLGEIDIVVAAEAIDALAFDHADAAFAALDLDYREP